MPDGRLKQCKTCEKAKQQAYYAVNKDRLLAQQKAYHHRTKAERNAKSREYHATHREERCAKQRAKYGADPELRRANNEASRRNYLARKEHFRALAKAYAKTERGKDAIRKAHARERELFPERIKARYCVSNAVRDGRLKKAKACEQCGKRGRIEAHHHKGYEPEHRLDVQWLCPPCHDIADLQQDQSWNQQQTPAS